MKQPNFETLFFDYFADKKFVHYRIRKDSNCIHDVYFLNSLLSDAIFKFNDIIQHKKTVTFQFNRFKNEWQFPNDNVVVSSLLRLSNVKHISWQMGSIHSHLINDLKLDSFQNCEQNTQYHMNKVFVDNDYYHSGGNVFKLILTGRPYRWVISIDFYDNWSIELKDIK